MIPKISIIVPVYHVEPYLNQCIDSILNQTLKDFELILIDDGGTDRCPQICDKYAQQDVRPSRFEGLPVVGIEAQANKRLCFVTDLVTNELNITNSIKYFPIQNGATVWAEAIHKILKNPLKNLCGFPKEYQIAYAAELLGERYLQLAERR